MRQDSTVDPQLGGALPAAIGLIGAGAMGHPMARHLQAALRLRGGELFLLDRSATHTPDLVDAGAVVVASPAEMARRAEAIVIMVPDLPQVAEVVEGPDGLLAGADADPGLIAIVGSTVSGPGLADLDRSLRARAGMSIRIVDAPVSGGVEGAQAATLSIMVGGNAADVASAWPVLSTYGTPRWLGAVGAGQTAKACNQLVVAATVAALGEAAVLAERAGLDLAVLFDLLSGGYAASRILETRGRRFVDDDFSVAGAARYMTKDLHAASALSDGLGVDAPILRAAYRLFQDIEHAGFGDLDIAVTKKLVAARSRG